uniref:Ig-like domain-containing protein n=1 Tax=Chrysemys picta bellii TaxID=8478 RepID=A0A8C3HYU6_CHRPI
MATESPQTSGLMPILSLSPNTAHYSKPSISLSPSGEIAPGTDVTISCRGPRQGVRFKMYRAGVARWHTEPAGSTAEFRIPNVRREDGGIYTCSYESLREPPVSSPHSDPVQLVVAGEGPGLASPLPAPPLTRPSGGQLLPPHNPRCVGGFIADPHPGG